MGKGEVLACIEILGGAGRVNDVCTHANIQRRYFPGWPVGWGIPSSGWGFLQHSKGHRLFMVTSPQRSLTSPQDLETPPAPPVGPLRFLPWEVETEGWGQAFFKV